MFTNTSKSQLQAFVLGQIMASALSFKLKEQYDVSPLEQSILLLTNIYQKQGFRVTGPLLTKAKLAHQRNTQQAIKALVEKGFIKKVKVERRLGLKILLTDKGDTIINCSLTLVRKQYKDLIL